ncbi:MAG: relaxase domain-containing protein [Verrucomicrobiae bacterium]|nr:relaxase domain-containing protein [Verrucomicrobiae bacterium]
MVIAKTQYSLRNAESYFKEHLCVGDYYDQGQRVTGEWVGEAAKQLGLRGEVLAADFLRLCENQDPSTGETLTVRLKSTRIEDDQVKANRRIFFDFTISPPKSVSIAALIGGDTRIEAAHQRAVRSALMELEPFAATRVRLAGKSDHRITGNMAAALFTHDTSRALDPHLHTHCIVFNATYDPKENRWKALENRELLRARRYVESVYYHELARQLQACGYQIRNQIRGDFEMVGVPEEMCIRFSKRHAQIDRALDALLQERPELSGANLKELREWLAIKGRQRKQPTLSRSELGTLWASQTTPAEREQIRQLSANSPSPALTVSDDQILREAVQWSEDHLFDRHSVVPEFQIWQEALDRLRGRQVPAPDLKRITAARGYIRDEHRPFEVTLRQVLAREWEIVQIAKNGHGECTPLIDEPRPLPVELDDEQRQALHRLLTSTNLVSLFRGGAGTGKSFVLRHLVKEVQSCGRVVVILAPQRQQVVEMERDGFPAPQTVASFLRSRELPRGALVVVDEAGQIGGQQMLDLLRTVRERNARVLLSGDTRQHGPVEASDALVAIERFSGVRPVELHTIRRQDPSLGRDELQRRQIRDYRKAVEAAANGKLSESFARLDAAGSVVTCGLADQVEKLSEEYVRIHEQNASAVVVSQTWTEVHRVNASIREALKAKGLLGHSEALVHSLDRLDLTNAQKRDHRFYPPEALILFNQKVRDTEPGKTGTLAGIVSGGVLVEVEGRFVSIPNRLLDRISVCRPHQLTVATGDRLHLKANRRLTSGSRVANGELVAVKAVRSDGAVELDDGRVLDSSYREFSPGYAITSYGSQGKTVDYVLFSDSTIKAATNAQQWYVTISRGRRGIRIFTPDKEQLRENLTRSGHRRLALDLAPGLVSQPRRRLWDRLHGHLLRFGRQAADRLVRLKPLRHRHKSTVPRHEHHQTT